MADRVLVMGATGTVGRGVVRELARRGVEAVAATRDPDGQAACGLGVPAVRFDLEDRTTWRPALAGVGAAFLMARPGDDEPERYAIPLLDEMRAAGVRRVVDLSAMGVEAREDLGLRKVERHLEASGLGFTHLRPNFFMQIFCSDPLRSGILSAGVIAIPAADARLSFVDAGDIAAVAAVALSGTGHEGRAYTLTGPEGLDHRSVARELSAASGRDIRYVALDEAAARGQLCASFPPARVERLMRFYRLVRAGFCSPVTDDVERVLGRPATGFGSFARAHASCWNPRTVHGRTQRQRVSA